MRTAVLLISLVTGALISCSEQSTGGPDVSTDLKPDTVNIGCLSAFEMNPNQTGETINRIYGKERIKHGHWIITEMEPAKNPQHQLTTRIRTEGYYHKNQKTGLWQTFDERGHLIDSVRF